MVLLEPRPDQPAGHTDKGMDIPSKDTGKAAPRLIAQESSDATAFWFHRFGRFVAPDADGWSGALMRRYPHADPARKVTTRLGGAEPARFLICETFAHGWAPVRPQVALPAQVSIRPTHARKRWEWILDIILDPPPPPFLAASVGLSGADADHWQLTTSSELIAFGGAAALFEGEHLVLVERRRFLEAVDWFARTGAGAGEVLRARDIRRRFGMGLISGAQARAALARLRTDARDFPGSANDFLVRLAALAAQGRQDGKLAA